MSKLTDLAAHWLSEEGPAALVRKDWLMPAEGWQSTIKPPTYAAARRGEDAGYAIDEYEENGRKIRTVLLDSLGAQANRAEPLFKLAPLRALVPQITITAGEHVVNLLDLGHRAADAIARYSELGRDLDAAFADLRRTGDARRLAAIAPTSLIFGAWDSRGSSQVKLARLVRSTIRAWDVVPLRQAAQFNPSLPLDVLDIVDGTAAELDAASELGLRHAPSRSNAGVLVRGEIRRDAMLSLAGLRAIGPLGPDGAALRAYLLGLALVMLATPEQHDLREGCLLVRDPGRPPVTEIVAHSGERIAIELSAADARGFAAAAAGAFGIGRDRDVMFDRDAARTAIAERAGGSAPAPRRGRARRTTLQDSDPAETA